MMEIEEVEGNSFVNFKVKNKISKTKNKDGTKQARNQNKKSKELVNNDILRGLKQQMETKERLSEQQKSDQQMGSESNEQCDSKPKENIRIVEMDIIPIVRHLKMQTVYMLAGDVMVDLDFGMKEDEHPICQISAINSFKNPIRVEMLKEQMSSEVDLTISQDSLKEFGKIIEILENYPQQYAHDFGKVLRQYQLFVTGQLKKAKFLKDTPGFKSLIPTFDAQYEEFLADTRSYLKNNITQNKFQFYMIVKSNMTSFTHDISRFGLSEGLCQLLGGNGDQICALILRRGLFEFFSKDTRNNFYFYYLSRLLNVKDVQIEKSISLVTLDGIELKVDYEMETYFGKDAEPNVLFFYPHMLIMINFEVKPYMVKQVLDIRDSLDSETLQFMKEFEEDVYYSLESQIFLESYYAEYYQKIVENNGQSLPKEKRKYKKHPQTKHQLDFRLQNQSIVQQLKPQRLKQQSTSSNPSQSSLPLDQVITQRESMEEFNDQQEYNNLQIESTHIQLENPPLYQSQVNEYQAEQIENFQPIISQESSSHKSYQFSDTHHNHLNQYPYISQNYNNYENLNVSNFNSQFKNNDKVIIPPNQQKIQLQENISIYQASQYANNSQKYEISKNYTQNNLSPLSQQQQQQQQQDIYEQNKSDEIQMNNNIIHSNNNYIINSNNNI